jgi:RND family efflux transporter MFP subunit
MEGRPGFKRLLRALASTSGVLLIIVITALSIQALQQQAGADHNDNSGEAALLPVSTLALQPESGFTTTARLTGRLHPAREVALAFEPAGRVVDIEVALGDAVSEGQILARLDTRRLLARRAEIQAQLDETAIALELARLEEDRQQSLRESDLNTRQALDRSRTERRRMEAMLSGLHAGLAGVDADIDDSALRAPFAGRITEKHIELGAMLSGSTPAFQLMDHRRLEARIGVPASKAAALVQAGETVTLNSRGQDFTGTVRSLIPEIDASRQTATLIVDVDNGNGLIPGQLVEWKTETLIEEPGYWVPTTALASGERGLWSLLVAEPDSNGIAIVRRASVEYLHGNGSHVFVRGTVNSGALVITEGAHRIVPGQRVQLLRQATP